MELTLEEVKEIARKAHEGQKRRGGADYFESHILDVWRRVVKYRQAKLETQLEVEIQQVALLHDAVENHGTTFEELREQGLDEWVLKMVDVLTHKKDEAYSDYILRVKNNHYAKLVKIADIFSNLSDNPTDRQRTKYIAALEVLLFEIA
jgi:(p)ppGpp synthase/HD superfamily hydrolase